MVSYNKLWKLLIDKEMKKKDLGDVAKVSANTLAKMGRNEAGFFRSTGSYLSRNEM